MQLPSWTELFLKVFPSERRVWWIVATVALFVCTRAVWAIVRFVATNEVSAVAYIGAEVAVPLYLGLFLWFS